MCKANKCAYKVIIPAGQNDAVAMVFVLPETYELSVQVAAVAPVDEPAVLGT